MKKWILFSFLFIFINISIIATDNNQINKIIINGKNINLKISSYDGKEIKLSQISHNKENIIQSDLSNNLLEYTLVDNRKPSIFRRKVKFTLLIPEDFNLNYEITSENSDIYMKNIKGNVSIKNSKGSIDIYKFKGICNINSINTKVSTRYTEGVLSVITTNKKINIIKADMIDKIVTSNAKVYAEFNEITPTAQVVSTNHTITIKIPQNHEFNFSIFGDLITVKSDFEPKDTDNFLVLGTSNGKIYIKKQKD